jgi:hypothetical protein
MFPDGSTGCILQASHDDDDAVQRAETRGIPSVINTL